MDTARLPNPVDRWRYVVGHCLRQNRGRRDRNDRSRELHLENYSRRPTRL